jgi:integrase
VTANYTVREAGAEYVQYLTTHKKSAHVMENVLKAHVYPKFGDRAIAKLTHDELQAWVDELPLQPPRRCSNTRHKPVNDAERMRQRKATANRIWSVFRGLLNYAHDKKRVPDRSAWSGIKSFENVGGARQVFLQPDQCQRLINATQGAFRRYVRALLYTGCRPGKEIEGPKVKHFDPANSSLHLADSKTNKPRDVYLTTEGAAFFAQITAGRHPDEPILLNDDGGPWENNALDRAMRKAVELAKLPADTVLYSLRHTYISLALKGGMNIKALADQCGTSIAMIERHYGKFLADDRRRMLNSAVPSFGFKSDNVRAMR